MRRCIRHARTKRKPSGSLLKGRSILYRNQNNRASHAYDSHILLDYISQLCKVNRILAHRGASSRGGPEGGARLGVLGQRGEKPWREEARVSDHRRLRPGADQPLGLPQALCCRAREVRHPQPKPPGGAPRGERTEIREVRCGPRLVSVVDAPRKRDR